LPMMPKQQTHNKHNNNNNRESRSATLILRTQQQFIDAAIV